MKFMKLGSKPDSFRSEEDCIRYVATELATDVVINVGAVKFYLHKFPLLSKSARLQKLITATTDEQSDNEICIPDIPGGPSAFEICAKFCYGMTVTLNAYNVVAVRCAAEYLEMYESIESGNLVYKIEVFLNSSVLRSWKDSIIVLQTTRSFYPWSEDVKIDVRCLESIALKAAMDPGRVDWSYTYNRRKLLPPEINNNGVTKDWWIEDLTELDIDLYKRVILVIRRKGMVLPEVIGEALEVYAMKRISDDDYDADERKCLLETLISLLPSEKQSVSCGFLIKLLKSLVSLDCGEEERKEISRRIGEKLEEANVVDLLIRAPEGCETVYDIDIVETLIEEFVAETQKRDKLDYSEINEGDEFVSESSKAVVAKLIDGYLAEISRIEPNLSSVKFIAISEKVSNFPRSSHDGVYRAIDMFLKQHPEITKSEKKSICRLMDCRKLSPEACAHAVQNERLPLRVVVQILFFEQVRATCPTTKPSLPPSGSHGSSRTTTEEECDSVTATEETTTPKDKTSSSEKAKAKGVVMSRLFSKLWTGKDRDGVGDVSSSDTSESPGSVTTVDNKSTPSTRRRKSSS